MLMHAKHTRTHANKSWFHELTKLAVKLLGEASENSEGFVWKQHARVMESSLAVTEDAWFYL